MIKYVLVTLSFTIAYSVFGILNFYQSKNIEPTLKNLLLYNLCIIPISFLMNLLLNFTFTKGYKAFGQMTPVTIIYLGVGVFSYGIVSYLFFKEIPKWHHLVAFILVFIALILCNWNSK